MKILLCNDDGIHADGIRHLRYAAAPFGEITIAAPNEERSAVGHAITVFDPIKLHEIHEFDGCKGYAVHGTPADAVKLAINHILPEPPDLVLSGINFGPNTGVSVIYSGTVSAASEAALLGVPSIAFSLCTYTEPLWDTAEAASSQILGALRNRRLEAGTLLNVNIPNLPLSEIRGIKWVPVAHSRWIETFEERQSPRRERYFWLGGVLKVLEEGRENDVHAVEDGFVSITPINLDLTHYKNLNEMKNWDLDFSTP